MMPLDPAAAAASVEAFLRDTAARTGKDMLVGVSGGIDSALTLTLLARALPGRVTAVLLPYRDQDMGDARSIVAWNGISGDQLRTIDIGDMVDAAMTLLTIGEDRVRRGNVMARMRMVALYDLAKSLDALVCGTENKSEHYLGYFTRFGDAASDVEPIHHLWKSDVRALANHLGIPQPLLDKQPTAGLWAGQTDETELGFTYTDADAVLRLHLDAGVPRERLAAESGRAADVVERVLARVDAQAFKREVPYAYHPLA